MTLAFRFGTVGSPKGKPKKPGGSVGAILYLRELGLDAFELGWVRSVRVSEKTCAAIAAAAAAQNVAMSVHAPYYINLNADETEWPKSRQRLMDAARFGALAGATDIVFHPGSYFGKPAEDALKVALPRLEGCLQELRDEGVQVTLRPETMGKAAMLGSLEDTLIMARSIPGVLPCLDFAHLHARAGDGSMNSHEEWCRVLEAYGKALGASALKRLHIHMSGIAYGERGERNHLPIRESDFNLEGLFRALQDFDAAGRIVCESPILEEDALYMKRLWQEITEAR